MNDWLKIGLIGTPITAVCCFTPFLVWTLTAIGAVSLIPYLDFVLLPLLGIFTMLLLAGLALRFVR